MEKYSRKVETRRNHFVPQVYLKGFSDIKGELNVCDKKSQKLFNCSPKNIAFMNDLYTAEDRNGEKSFEKYYAQKIDNNYDSIVAKIKKYQKSSVVIKPLEMEDIKIQLANYIANQILRIPETIFSSYINYSNFLENIKSEIKKIEKEEGEFEEYIKSVNIFEQESFYKDGILTSITSDKLVKRISFELLKKPWILYKNESKELFWISDNPVIRYNLEQKNFKAGISKENAFIGFPISKEYYLTITPNNYLFLNMKLISGRCYVIDDREIETIKLWNSFQLKACNRFLFYIKGVL